VLGMALSIEFGIAKTYGLGAGFYVVCIAMIVIGRQAKWTSASAANPAGEPALLRPHNVASAAPSIQPAQIELFDVEATKSPEPAMRARTAEVIE
jgi:hypothetical protein